jgi:hypothetical protein
MVAGAISPSCTVDVACRNCEFGTEKVKRTVRASSAS